MKRANRKIVWIMSVIAIACSLVVGNAIYTMATGTHLRSGVNIKESWTGAENQINEVVADRGKIKDRNGNTIAEDLETYSIYAIVSSSRKSGDEIQYVKNVDKTAKQLAPYLNMEETEIASILQRAIDHDQYQTEFGARGRNLKSAVKEEIESLELPGIEFSKSSVRYYPSGKFASTLIGFATYDENENRQVGQMGLEAFMDQKLKGVNGIERYKQTISGAQLGSKYVEKQAVDGNDVNLTLDKNVQLALESALAQTMTDFNCKRAWAIIMECETGRILGWSGYPTFNLNEKEDIESYLDLPSSFNFEPGSVMKAFTYAAAINEGVYDGDALVQTGTFNWYYDAENDDIVRTNEAQPGYWSIHDALGKNWGMISFDKALTYSANTAICQLLADYLDPDVFESYLDRFGFFKEVGVYGVSEGTGEKNFTYPVEKLTTGFGQGSSVTALQLMQAYSAIFNEGKMVKPYYIDSVVNPYNGEVLYKGKTEITGEPITADTAAQMVELLDAVVNSEDGTGRKYAMDDVRVIAKTGTAEIAENGKYNASVYINSVMAAAPKDDPKIMMYYAFESDQYLTYTGDNFKQAFREALVAVNAMGGVTHDESDNSYTNWQEYSMPAIVNHSLDYANQKLEGMDVNIVMIGNGSSVVKQYPKAQEAIITKQNIFVVTEGDNIVMPNMNGWTLKDVMTFQELTGIEIKVSGSGSVTAQNVAQGATINSESDISVTLN